jgi:CRISPR-associated protein Cas1
MMIKRTLYFENPAYLHTANKQLCIDCRSEDVKEYKAESRVPIEDIGVCVLDNPQITISHGAINRLLANNCAVMFCDDRHIPSGLLLPLVGNETQSERHRAQVEAKLPMRKRLWAQTVQAKIFNQAAMLTMAGYDNGALLRFANSVKSGDAGNLEGRAAARYWKVIFKSMGVEGVTRDREGEPPNNMLNYGYAVLRAVIARALVGSGLLPSLGVHHRNRYNPYCLADDAMEPYRPFVDMLVYRYVAVHGAPMQLGKDEKKLLLGLPVMDVKIDGEKSPLMVAAQRTSASLAACYLNEKRNILYPVFG